MKVDLAPWILGALFLAALLPTLNSTRLCEVDELIYASVAKEAAVDGHWMPLTWGGKPWVEKPPLLLWLAAATAKASGTPLESWPYRLWCCLGGALAVAALSRLGRLAGQAWAGILGGLLFGLQGDVLFHARFFSMDLAMIACGLWSCCRAAQGRYPSAGAILALGVWIKSWFVLAFFPALAFPLLLMGDRAAGRRAIAWIFGPPLLSLAVLILFYWWVYGTGYLHFEFMGNLWERFQGLSNVRQEDNLSYYGKWAMRSAAALVPLSLAAPVALLLRPWPEGEKRASVQCVAVLALSWLLALCLMKAQVINYLLSLEAALCLCWALALEGDGSALGGWILAALAALSLASLRGLLPVELLLLGSAAAATALFLARGRASQHWDLAGVGAPPPRGFAGAGAPQVVAWALAGLALLLLGHSAWSYLRHPEDPSRQVADLLLAHPARSEGEPLWLLGQNTQATAFYSSYNIRRLEPVPAQRPAEAVLAHTHEGWIFYPPLR